MRLKSYSVTLSPGSVKPLRSSSKRMEAGSRSAAFTTMFLGPTRIDWTGLATNPNFISLSLKVTRISPASRMPFSSRIGAQHELTYVPSTSATDGARGRVRKKIPMTIANSASATRLLRKLRSEGSLVITDLVMTQTCFCSKGPASEGRLRVEIRRWLPARNRAIDRQPASKPPGLQPQIFTNRSAAYWQARHSS